MRHLLIIVNIITETITNAQVLIEKKICGDAMKIRIENFTLDKMIRAIY